MPRRKLLALPQTIFYSQKRGTTPAEPPPTGCTGDLDCTADEHIHGCFSDLREWRRKAVKADAEHSWSLWAARREGEALRTENKRLHDALQVLLDASAPYVERAAPHEQLFSGEDLWNLDRLTAARAESIEALASRTT